MVLSCGVVVSIISSFAIILSDCFTLIVFFIMSCGRLFTESLPCGAIDWSFFCDCGFS